MKNVYKIILSLAFLGIVLGLGIDTKVNMDIAHASFNGASDALVAPMDTTKYLRGDGTWVTLNPAAMGIAGGTSDQYYDGVLGLHTFPSIPSAQIQSDWNQAGTGSLDYIKNKPVRSFANSVTHTIVTVAAAANGFQVSSTRDAQVNYSTTMVTAATIGGSSSGTVVLEVCATNSSTAASWQEIARFTNGQAITLAIALNSTQTTAGNVSGMIPAGYYARIRSINNSGTPTFTYNSGQEVLF